MRHSQGDYQKVYDAIAHELDVEGYDGEFPSTHSAEKASRIETYFGNSQTDPSHLS